jgi:hypothetical protein
VPNRDGSPDNPPHSLDCADSKHVAFSIRRDFATLVEVLERQLETLSPSDERSRSHILKAKEVAQRGVALSQQLIEQTQPRQ